MPFFGMKLKADGKAQKADIPAGAILTIQRVALNPDAAKDSSRSIIEAVNDKGEAFALCRPLSAKGTFHQELNYQCLPEDIVSASFDYYYF